MIDGNGGLYLSWLIGYSWDLENCNLNPDCPGLAVWTTLASISHGPPASVSGMHHHTWLVPFTLGTPGSPNPLHLSTSQPLFFCIPLWVISILLFSSLPMASWAVLSVNVLTNERFVVSVPIPIISFHLLFPLLLPFSSFSFTFQLTGSKPLYVG